MPNRQVSVRALLPFLLGTALSSCCTPGTWSFPVTSPLWCEASTGTRMGAGHVLGPLILIGYVVDVAILPVTGVHDLFFRDAAGAGDTAEAPRQASR